MTVDHSKIQYYTGNNAYKNLGVYSGTISVDTTHVPAGGVHTWSSTVSVEPSSRFAFAQIEVNDVSLLGVPSALRWNSFPQANVVYQTLSLNPLGDPYFQLFLDVLVNNNQVTFSAWAFNPNASDYAFNAIGIDFIYAAHTTSI